MAVNLVRGLERMTMASNKRSFCEAFLDSESKEESRTKMSTRLQLARVVNRIDRLYQNMLKTKERIKQQLEKLREIEAQHDMAKAEAVGLKQVLSKGECEQD